MHQWADYFVAMAGAAAGLTGLVFVGLSISLNKILAAPRLVNRGLESLILLATILIISSLCLVPEQSLSALATEILIVGGLVWFIALYLDISMFTTTDKEYKKSAIVMVLLSQLAVLPYVTGAVVMLVCGAAGIYWLVPAIIFSFIKSLLDAWVLLIEINR